MGIGQLTGNLAVVVPVRRYLAGGTSPICSCSQPSVHMYCDDEECFESECVVRCGPVVVEGGIVRRIVGVLT